MSEIKYKDVQRLIFQATQLKNELMKLGLVKTYHVMDTVTKQIGWEAAEIIEGEHPVAVLKSRKNFHRTK